MKNTCREAILSCDKSKIAFLIPEKLVCIQECKPAFWVASVLPAVLWADIQTSYWSHRLLTASAWLAAADQDQVSRRIQTASHCSRGSRGLWRMEAAEPAFQVILNNILSASQRILFSQMINYLLKNGIWARKVSGFIPCGRWERVGASSRINNADIRQTKKTISHYDLN